MINKLKYLSVIIIILSGIILIQGCSPDLEQQTRDNINQVLDKYCDAYTVNTRNKFEKLLNDVMTDDFIYIKEHPTGAKLTRSRIQVIRNFAEMINNTLDPVRKLKDREIYVISQNKVKVKAIFKKGYNLDNRPYHTDIILIKKNNKWQIKKITIKKLKYDLSLSNIQKKMI